MDNNKWGWTQIPLPGFETPIIKEQDGEMWCNHDWRIQIGFVKDIFVCDVCKKEREIDHNHTKNSWDKT